MKVSRQQQQGHHEARGHDVSPLRQCRLALSGLLGQTGNGCERTLACGAHHAQQHRLAQIDGTARRFLAGLEGLRTAFA